MARAVTAGAGAITLVLAAPALAGALSPAQINAINRATWGVNSAALNPGNLFQTGDPALPPAAEAQIAAMRISREPMDQLVMEMQAENKAAGALTDPAQRQAARTAWQKQMAEIAREAATRSLLRDLYSPAQLQEQMTWFWFNHFNVHAQKREIRAMIAGYEDSLRAHALGRFRDLLEASLRSPAMLEYLDNDQNAAGHINENYAREIMELHTMGVGSGYTQKDVQELARILTGVGVRFDRDDPPLKPQLQPFYGRQGLFVFNPAKHDFGTKKFLGHTIGGPDLAHAGPNAGFPEVEQALDLIAASPATAHHVSAQIAQYFIGDGASPALVNSLAAAWTRSGGDIKAVLQALFAAPEYKASLAPGAPGNFKDPMHYVISAVRLAYDGPNGGKVILNADPMLGWLNRMGEPLYGCETPDGYPLSASYWTGPGQMEMRFEIAKTIGNGSAGLFRPHDPASDPPALMATGPMNGAMATPAGLTGGWSTLPQRVTPVPGDRPAFPQLQNALYYNALAQTLSPQTSAALGQATSAEEWNMLFLSSPDFMRR